MRKTNLLKIVSGIMVASMLLAGCGGAGVSTSISTDTGVNTSTEVSVSTETSTDKETASASTETSVSTETSASTETSTVEEPEEEETGSRVKHFTCYYYYEPGVPTLANEEEYDEYGYTVKYMAIGDCDEEYPYTATRSVDGDYVIYTCTYDFTGYNAEQVEYSKSWLCDYTKYNANGDAVLVRYLDGREEICEYNEKGKMISFITDYSWGHYEDLYTYDEKGNTLTNKRISGEYVYLSEYTYNANDQVTEFAYSSAYSNYRTYYTYDENGYAATERMVDDDGSERITIYDCNEKGTIIHYVIKNALTDAVESETSYVYDANGLLLKEERTYSSYYSEGYTSTQVLEYEYDSNGRQTNQISKYYYNGELNEDDTSQWSMSYDDHGNLLSEVYSSSWYTYSYDYKYEYDDLGNVLVRDSFSDGDQMSHIEYEYFY